MTNQEQYDQLKNAFDSSFRNYIDIEKSIGQPFIEKFGDLTAFPDLERAYYRWKASLTQFVAFKEKMKDFSMSEELIKSNTSVRQIRPEQSLIYHLVINTLIFFGW